MDDVKEVCSFEDFEKVDIRCGEVVECKPVPKSKLLELKVYFGELGTKTILAGIAKHYDATGIVGQRVVAVVNLPPREMKGIISEGMILCATSADNSAIMLLQCMGQVLGAKVG